jgi:4-diphosphocytidyl-2-C-methyl-D-erythritol kinase
LTARVVRVPSFAKVNLGLEVLGRRQDGYHELRTLFQSLDLRDDVRLRLTGDGVVVRCDHPGVPKDDSNLAFRAARLLLDWARSARGVQIEIVKRIPVAGGMGGGSSNAAAVLMALDRMLGLDLGPAGLHPMACRLGADVPYFLLGGTALGLGRGDEVYPLARQLEAQVVVVDPGMPISTAAVFQRADACLTPRENSRTIFHFVSRDLEGRGGIGQPSNELEAAALDEVPELRPLIERIRATLVGGGARLAALSGSGAAYFGVFDDPRRARRAEAELRGAGLRTLRGCTLTLDQYRRAWSLALRGVGPRAAGPGKERTTWRSRTSRSSRWTTKS